MESTLKTQQALTGTDLVQKLTIAAVEVYILGGEAGDGDVKGFRNAIPLVSRAWELENGKSDEALALIDQQHEAVRYAEKNGKDMKCVLDEKLLLDTPSGEEIMAVTWGLIETIVRLDNREDREQLAALTHYLKDFWDLAGHIAF